MNGNSVRSLRVVAVAVLAALVLTPTAARAAPPASTIVDERAPGNQWMVRGYAYGDLWCSGTALNRWWVLTVMDCVGPGPNSEIEAAGRRFPIAFGARHGQMYLVRLSSPIPGLPDTVLPLARQSPAIGTRVFRYSGSDSRFYRSSPVTILENAYGRDHRDINLITSGGDGLPSFHEGGAVIWGGVLVGVSYFLTRTNPDGSWDYDGPISVLGIAEHRQWIVDTMAAYPPLIVDTGQCPIFLCR
ncbi:hypothetical protein JIG36_14195 [Actinoplanes sp. LDG1-06]|uniref:Uncharacterized protein n=1 Tax=Paractinoplanes ovalisporus TaxID=2810368 RepID=A0ABS2AA49_9ACTN|nr:hypothetical protein [Actinoplanes ovalisporus]MBM2616709.1 hypothetical protein [Actinoplanes ovalisporus]